MNSRPQPESDLRSLWAGGLKKELLWVVGGQLLAAVGSLVGVIVITHQLNPSQYGELLLALTIVLLAEQVLLSPIGAALARYYAPARAASELATYLRGARRLMFQALLTPLLVGLLSAVVGLFTQATIALLVFLACLFTVIRGCETGLGSIQAAARHRTVVACHQAAGAWIRWAFAVAACILAGPSSTSVLAGYCAGAGVVLLSQAFYFQRMLVAPDTVVAEGGRSSERTWASTLWSFAWPFATWGLVTWAHLVSDRWALEIFTDRATVGRYGVAYQLGYFPVLLGANALMAFVGPLLYDRAGGADRQELVEVVLELNHRLVKLVVGVAVCVSVISFWLARPFLATVAPEEYVPAGSLLPPLLLAGGLFAAAQLASQGPMVTLAPRRLIAPKIVTATFGVGINALSASIWGVEGVVFAMVGFSATYLLWMVWLGRELMKSIRARSG